MISCAVIKIRTAALNRSMSNAPSASLNFIKFNEARLHAVLSRKRYSEQGLVEFCRAVPLQVCHLWMVVSNCIPGIAADMRALRDFAQKRARIFFSHGLPSRTLRVHHSRPSIAASMNSSLTRTLRFSF